MNFLKILGVSGSKTQSKGTSSFLVSKEILIDAGNVINSLGDDILKINHVFITHSHSDHILDLPFIIESFFEKRKETLKIYASKQTLESLRKHTFNSEIWPDFSKINLLGSEKKSLEFIEVKKDETIVLNGFEIKALEANHIDGAYEYKVIKDETGFVISGDTYKNDSLIKELNEDKRVKSLLIECSFPSSK